MTGVIVKGIGGLYTVACETGLYACGARGLFKLKKITPLIGDRAEIEVTDEAAKAGYVVEISPRHSELTRPRAANVDSCLCVIAAAEPAPILESLDITIINALAAGLTPVIAVSKADLDGRGFIDETRRAYKSFGFAAVSIKNGAGFDELSGLLRGKTTVLSGVSGVGKSSLLNALSGKEAMATGGLSEKIKRGKHTTRHAELVAADAHGTYIIDTPGFSNIEVLTGRNDFDAFYPEFAPFIGNCYYGDCRHISEHDCAVKAAVGAEVDEGRYSRYVGICEKYTRRGK